MLKKSKVYKINCSCPDFKVVNQAVRIIKRGGLVIFPTETLYGLGTIFNNKKGISKIYQLRKRPKNKALLILIASRRDIGKYAYFKPLVSKLINKFWPGPLTFILNKKTIVPNFITANKKTVAIRMPENKFLLALIKKIKKPIVAPSANISGRKSPINIKQVAKYFYNKVDLILDGGQTKYKKESTILDLTQYPPKILREGAIKEKQLRPYL